jgi:hypothetical protein
MVLGGGDNLVVLVSFFDFVEILFYTFWGDIIFMVAASLYVSFT